MSTQSNHLKQPRVFLLAVATALFERCGFYVLAFLMVLYTKSQFQLTDQSAYVLYGILNALVFLTPAVGGWMADNLIGIKRTMFIGLLLEGAGLTCVSFPSKHMFLTGLALVIMGVGFFKTGPTDLLGRSYKNDDPRIDSGFTYYYMAMNVGSFCSPVVAGLLQHRFGWQPAFLFGAAVLYLNLLMFLLLRHRADGLGVEAGKKPLTPKLTVLLLCGLVATALLSIFLLNYPIAAHIFFVAATIVIFLYFGFEISRSPNKERLEIIACIALILIGMVFFVMYFQYYMSITLFIKRSINHHILGHTIPTEAFLSLNAFWIIVLSPMLVYAYNLLRRSNGKDMAITTKFPLGLLFISLAFLILKVGTIFHNSFYQVSWLWLFFAIGIYSLGELLVSALGVAMVTHIAPRRLYGVMMGAWYLIAAALASSLSSSVANLAAIPSTMHDPQTILNIYGNAFFEIGIGGIIATVIAFAVSPYIKKIAHIK